MFYLLAIILTVYTTVPAQTQIDAEFEPYMRMTSLKMGQLIADSHLVLKLGVVKDKEVVGFCAKEYSPFGDITRRLIVIDKTHWKRLSYKVRQLLLYHELAHCLLNKKHDERFRLDGCPLSIMYPTILSEYCAEEHYADYLLELF